MKCFYHTDFDGECSAAIVYNYYKQNFNQEIKCFPINYNNDFPFDIIEQDELVIIVDFSLQKEGEFEKLIEITKNIIWIDHHKTAIEKHKNLDDQYKFQGIRSTESAGCVLTWKHFHPNRKVPTVIELLGDYDTWTFKYGDKTKFFQEGIKLQNTSPESDNWKMWFDETYIEYIINNGKVAVLYRDKYYSKLIKEWSFFTEFEGYKAVACNAGKVGSHLFESVKEDYDIMLAYVHDGELWTVSIYTTRKDIDVSEIAMKYGGGGHPQASGFTVAKLPFKRIN